MGWGVGGGGVFEYNDDWNFHNYYEKYYKPGNN